MSRNKVCIVIPVYKPHLTDSEVKSLEQCFKVLDKRQISLVCANSLNVSFYESIASGYKKQITINRFNDTYFVSIQSYSRLLLSLEFYERFRDFEFILVYQLDAWVFSDELDYWCQKDYDYIGAPWFEKCGLHENGNKLWAVGNGGFSLRRISSFLNIFYYKRPLFTIKGLKAIHPKKRRFIGKLSIIIIICIKRSGWGNNSNYYLKKFEKNEDGFWSVFLQRSRKPMKLPNCEEALKFSFESSPSYLYELNGERLPFGCHAWEKNEYNSFWKNFIEDQE
jgi:hypothetical protein